MPKFVFLILFVLANLLFSYTTTSQSSSNKIEVAVIVPLSGDAASIGQAIKNGFELGLTKISKQARNRININYEDDGLAPKNSVSAFKKLASQNKVDILINPSSGTAKALAPLAEERKIPFIAIASDPEIVKNKKYAFNFWVTPDEEAKVALSEARKRNYKKIARISTTVAGAVAINSAFDKHNNGQIAISLDEEYSPEVKDFKPYIAKLRQIKDLDAIFVVLFPGQSGLFAKQVRQLGIKQDLFSIEMFEDAEAVKDSNGTLLGCWYVSNDNPTESFINEYKSTFPGASFWGASTSYDAAILIGAALDNGYDQHSLNTYMNNLKDFKGALGSYSASGDNRFTMPAAVKIVTKDGFEKLYK